MAEICNTINDVLPTLLYFVPALLGFSVFLRGISWAIRICGGSVCSTSDTKDSDTKEPESFDIPEKQKDFIQLN